MIVIDRTVFKKHLTSHNNGECVTCNMTIRKAKNTVCKPCIMKVHSKQGFDKDGNPKYGCALKSRNVPFMKEFPPVKRIEVGKCQAFFYLYYPELNYKLPDDPKMDVMGRFNKLLLSESEIIEGKKEGKEFRKLWYLVHHIDDDHNNDRKENLALVVNSEHTRLHSKKSWKPQEKEEFIQKIKSRNLRDHGKEYWG